MVFPVSTKLTTPAFSRTNEGGVNFVAHPETVMRLALPVIFVLFLALGCVADDEEPECDFEDGEVMCTCDDGNEGDLFCNEEGTADCICDGGDEE